MDNQGEFDIIYKRYYTPLFIFAKRFVEDDEDCHDLLNDVFEDVWVHFQEIKQEAIKVYLYTVLRRKCLDFLRHKKTERKFFDFSYALMERYDTMDRIREMEERETRIQIVLDTLPPPTKEIFVQCFVEHKKYMETAEALGISISTVKKHIVRALKMIRKMREAP